MTQLRITITKGAATDRIEIDTQGENGFVFDFPKKGPIPHDAVHYFVETMLSMRQGFWGMIASGVAPEMVQEIAKAGGHASAKRASLPDAGIIELLQAERIVECFEADFWSEPAPNDTFRAVIEAACASSFVAAPALSDLQIASIRDAIGAFAKAWVSAPAGARFNFDYPADRAAS